MPTAQTSQRPLARRHPAFARLTLTLAVLGATLTFGAASAQACGSSLPVTTGLPSGFAASYVHFMPVKVSSRGPVIRGVTAQLYTFAGQLLGRSRTYPSLSGSKIVKIKLRFPMQVGRFTLVIGGTAPGCGFAKRTQIVRLFPCFTALPVTFPQPPTGAASSFSGSIALNISTRGPVIRKLHASMSDFSGNLFGAGDLKILFGQTAINLRLSQALVPGSYTVFVTGAVDEPRSCGLKSGKLILMLS